MARLIDESRCQIALELAMKEGERLKAMRFWLAIVAAALILQRISLAAVANP